VQVGATSVSAVEIAGGLKEGDRAVVSGTEIFEHAPRVTLSE
jgi:HlyD family secretion protein